MPFPGTRKNRKSSYAFPVENIPIMVIIRKPLKFEVYWFLNYENRFSGSKVMTEKPTEIGHFFECPNF